MIKEQTPQTINNEVKEDVKRMVDKMSRATAASNKAYPKGIYIPDLRTAYANGYMQAEKDLTDWHSPTEYPQNQYEVLAKIDGGYFKVVVFDFNKKLWKVSGSLEYISILGWREINEF